MTEYQGLPARQTTYKGVQMRSRLEARFAAWLDGKAIAWAYEPRAYGGDGGQYLPDFELLDRDWPREFVEVKPTVTSALRVMRRMQVVWESVPDAWLMVCTADGPTWGAAGTGQPDWPAHKWRLMGVSAWSRMQAGR